MLHSRNILVAVDFSAPSRVAFELACEFAEQFGAALHVLHVRAASPEDALVGGPFTVRTFEDYARQTISQMDVFLGDTSRHCFPVVSAFRNGRPAEEIVDYATNHDMGLIVIGTHGHTGMKHLLLGSVAEEVVRTAKCNVLTAHERDRERFRMTALSRQTQTV